MPADPDTHELAAAYALDALDPAERRAFEEHLAGCARCRADVTSFGDVTLALADAAADDELPPGLRERVLAAARAEPLNVVPLAAARERRAAAATGRLATATRPRVLLPALAASAAAAVALGVWGADLSGTLDRERAARRSEASALAAFADPAARRSASGTASLAVAGGRGALSLARLAPAPAGKTYQAWVIPPGGKPIPAGLFDARGGRAVIVLEPTVEPGAIVAITLEPAGGVDAPTSEPLVAVKTSVA